MTEADTKQEHDDERDDEQPRQVPALVATGGPVTPIIPHSFDDVQRIANVVLASGLAPRGLTSMPQIIMVIMHGLEVGLLPMQALQSIALINGRPSLWGDGMLAVVRRSALLELITERIKDEDGELLAICVVKRAGKLTRRTFSQRDAKVAGLWNKPGTWQGYPKRMLQMRARAFALRDAFPDVLKGMASAEEMSDIASPEAGNGGGGGKVNVPPPPPGPDSVIWDEHEERQATTQD